LQLRSLTLTALDGSQQSTSRGHFTPGNKAQCPSNRRLRGPDRQFGQSVKEKKALPLPAYKTQVTTRNHPGSLENLSNSANWSITKYEDKWYNDGTILNTYFICYYMFMSQWYNTLLYQNQSAVKTGETH